MPGILQGLHLVADSSAEQADEVQAVQLEFQTAVQVQKALPIRHSPPEKAQTKISTVNYVDTDQQTRGSVF